MERPLPKRTEALMATSAIAFAISFYIALSIIVVALAIRVAKALVM